MNKEHEVKSEQELEMEREIKALHIRCFLLAILGAAGIVLCLLGIGLVTYYSQKYGW
jgi:hypothetical protein